MITVTQETIVAGEVQFILTDSVGLRLRVLPSRGGEIVSLCRRWSDEWLELLYRASGEGWRGGAPWLFPAVGRNIVEERRAWRIDETVLPMPIHGFVKESPWSGVIQGNAVFCRTESDAASRLMYPFDYSLEAAYSIVEGAVRARMTVTAAKSNRVPMPFSIGNHLTLKLPFLPGSEAGAHFVRCPAHRQEILNERGLLTGERVPIDLGSGVRLQDDGRFKSCVLGGILPHERWAEVTDPASFTVRVGQREVVATGDSAKADDEYFRFVFYGDQERTFLCPEPWYGGPDSLNTGRGVIRLAPGDRFTWEMTISFPQ